MLWTIWSRFRFRKYVHKRRDGALDRPLRTTYTLTTLSNPTVKVSSFAIYTDRWTGHRFLGEKIYMYVFI